MKSRTKEYFNKFSKSKVNYEDVKEAGKFAKKLGTSGEDFKTLLSMFKAASKGNFKLTGGELATLIGAIIYVVSPIDAIPDFIPLLGFGDDISVIVMVISSLAKSVERFKTEQIEKSNKDSKE